MTPAIGVHNLGKCYRIGTKGYRTLRESLVDAAARGLRRLSRRGPAGPEPFWALKAVGFEVPAGEVVGVIGRNGAGKSTLLKILSRITRPTVGEVTVRGRVGSLLEVGTGFHPELTGRENVYLNGAILGISRRDIARCFDEIVAFSEIEPFIDTPVKRYSSGMYLRLAFAVAAQLRSDILLVDEVLAVGDAGFQKKCLDRMSGVGREGRTVLFVSHNLHAVAQLCRRTILLDGGKVAAYGRTADVVRRYLDAGHAGCGRAAWRFDEAPGTGYVKLAGVRAARADGQPSGSFAAAESVTLEMDFWVLRPTRMTPSFHVYNQMGLLLFAVSNLHDPSWGRREYGPGLYRCACSVPANFLNEGHYFVTVYLTRDNNAGLVEVKRDEAVTFQVVDGGTVRGDYVGEWIGLVRPLLPWTGCRLRDLADAPETFDDRPIGGNGVIAKWIG